MHPDRAHTTGVAIAEKILQIAQPWREPALGAENGLHTSFCRKVDQFSRGLRVRRQGPLAVHGLPRIDRCAYRFLVLRTCREHEDDVDVWMANQFIDRSDDMPDTGRMPRNITRPARRSSGSSVGSQMNSADSDSNDGHLGPRSDVNGDASTGQQLAQKWCSDCHAVGAGMP